MINPRDIEELSASLDGQLNSNDSARLESRLKADPELVSVLNELRAARGILRKLPARKAPRNFTLTRKMVGLKPPLPRSYSFFRFTTASAALLLLLTFAAYLLPGRGGSAAAPVQSFAQCNACGGGGPAATEAPAAEAPSLEQAIAPTATLARPSADSGLNGGPPTVESPLPKSATTESAAQDKSTKQPESNVLLNWQILLIVLTLLGGSIMFLLYRSAMQRWK